MGRRNIFGVPLKDAVTRGFEVPDVVDLSLQVLSYCVPCDIALFRFVRKDEDTIHPDVLELMHSFEEYNPLSDEKSPAASVSAPELLVGVLGEYLSSLPHPLIPPRFFGLLTFIHENIKSESRKVQLVKIIIYKMPDVSIKTLVQLLTWFKNTGLPPSYISGLFGVSIIRSHRNVDEESAEMKSVSESIFSFMITHAEEIALKIPVGANESVPSEDDIPFSLNGITSRDSDSVLGETAVFYAGERITLVALHNKDWVEVITSDGSQGFAHLDSFKLVVNSHEVFIKKREHLTKTPDKAGDTSPESPNRSCDGPMEALNVPGDKAIKILCDPNDKAVKSPNELSGNNDDDYRINDDNGEKSEFNIFQPQEGPFPGAKKTTRPELVSRTQVTTDRKSETQQQRKGDATVNAPGNFIPGETLTSVKRKEVPAMRPRNFSVSKDNVNVFSKIEQKTSKWNIVVTSSSRGHRMTTNSKTLPRMKLAASRASFTLRDYKSSSSLQVPVIKKDPISPRPLTAAERKNQIEALEAEYRLKLKILENSYFMNTQVLISRHEAQIRQITQYYDGYDEKMFKLQQEQEMQELHDMHMEEVAALKKKYDDVIAELENEPSWRGFSKAKRLSSSSSIEPQKVFMACHRKLLDDVNLGAEQDSNTENVK